MGLHRTRSPLFYPTEETTVLDVAYYNGKIGPMCELMIPVADRAVYFGDGCYDATFVLDSKALALDEHIERFMSSCAAIELRLPFDREGLRRELTKVMDAYDRGAQGLLYWQASRGSAPRSHPFPEGVPANLLIFIKPNKMTGFDHTTGLISVEDTRFFHCNIKTIDLLPNVLASQRAKEAGCDDAVFHRSGRVTEGSHTNVHMLRDGVFHTAPLDRLILPGIARRHLINACRACGIPVDETPYTLSELMSADEIIISSSSVPCCSVTHIDGVAVGGRAPELLEKLHAYLAEEINGFYGQKLI